MPSTTSTVLAAVLAGVASAGLAPRQMTTTACADVHIILAKGNNEPYPGRQSKLVTGICKGMSSCDYEDVQWQNMASDEYCGSVTQGTTNALKQINNYAKRCPNSKLVLSGFSQGAQVIGDVITGAGGTLVQGCVEPDLPNLDSTGNAGRQIAVILTFGDPRHTPYQPYDYVGASGALKWGVFPRNTKQLSNGMKYAGVWRDYCNGEDTLCASGNDLTEHLNYMDKWGDHAIAYARQRLATFQAPQSQRQQPSPSTSAVSQQQPGSNSTGSGAPIGITSSRMPYSNSSATASGSAQVAMMTTTMTDDKGVVYTTVCPVTQQPTVAQVMTTSTVTDANGVVYTTVCPVNQDSAYPQPTADVGTYSYVQNPATVVPPADHSLTASCPYPFPEATHSTTENLSALPITAGPTPTGGRATGTGGVGAMSSTTGSVQVSGSASVLSRMGLCSVVAGLVGFAVLI